MWGKNNYFIGFLLFILLLFTLFDIVSGQYVERVPQGVGFNEENEEVISVIISTQAQAGESYRGGRPLEEQLLGHRKRSILGQRFIGIGTDDGTKVELGMEKMVNYVPIINSTTIDANKTLTKHPHTNNTLMCSINITDKDIGDRLTIHVKWYRNSSSWYDNSLDIDYNELSELVETLGIQFEEWHNNNETWYHTMVGSDFYETRTSPFRVYEIYDDRVDIIGSISPEDTRHYDLWICSAQVYDGIARTNWQNSTPIFIFNHRPDYDNSMRTYYSFKEDNTKTIDIGSYFSDIDNDEIDYYIDYTSPSNPGRFSYEDVSISINNVTGLITFEPNPDITGYKDIRFTAVDRNDSITNDWYLRNDYGHTSTDVLTLNLLQVNDPPWASEVYITSSLPGYQDDLSCVHTYNDIENHPENLTATSYKWWRQDQGLGPWIEIDNNSSVLTSNNFELNDRIKCAVRVKDTYYNWHGYTWLRTNAFGRLIGSTYHDEDNWEKPYETFKNVVYEDEWLHIVNTIDLNQNIRRIYVNGNLVKESRDEVNILENENLINWRLGQRDGSFEGKMDEVAIWDKKLSHEEIYELYTGYRFGYKFYGEEFTGVEPIVIDHDGSGLYTNQADLLFVDNTINLSLNEGDQLYKVTKNHRIFADSTDPNVVSCIYTGTELEINDGIVPLENYFLGNNCSNYGGTFIIPADIQIIEEHNWVINTPNIDLDETSFIYETNHGSLSYSSRADEVIYGTPTPGGKLNTFPHNIVFNDANGNGVFNDGESIVRDNNCDLVYNDGDQVLRGSNPSNNAQLTKFNSGPRTYPFQYNINYNLEDDLRAYYNFNNDYDSSLGDYHGTNQGTSFVDGIGCNAVQFSKESFIDLNLNKTNVYTISMWVKFDSLPEFPWQYTPDFLPNMPWLYSGDDVDQSLWSLEYTNSSAIIVVLETTDPTDEGQIVIGVG